MRHSQGCSIRFRRCRPSGEEEEEVAVNEVAVEVEEQVEDQVNPSLPSIGVPNTLIYQQESGKDAECISNGGGEVIFVVNHHRVHGKMSMLASQQNNEE